MSEKTWRRHSTDEEVKKVIIRATKALKGTSEKLTRHRLARQAARYLENRGAPYVLKILDQMTPEELGGIVLQPDPGVPRASANRSPHSSERWR